MGCHEFLKSGSDEVYKAERCCEEKLATHNAVNACVKVFGVANVG